MNKLDNVKLLRDLIKEHNLTAYEIAKNTGLSNIGVQKIISGDTKSPNPATLSKIFEYIENGIKGTNVKPNMVSEPLPEYSKGLSKDEQIDLLMKTVKYQEEIIDILKTKIAEKK